MADLVLKDRSGSGITYPGINALRIKTGDGSTQDFVAGQLEEKSIDPDFSSGNMEVLPEDGSFFSKVTVQKPESLTPENVANGVEIAGVHGTFLGDTEEATVGLNMADGDQIVLPSANGKVISKVTVQKPETLIPENIAEGVDIAGILGTFTGSEMPFVEYTLNDIGEIITAKLYGFTDIPGGLFAYCGSLESVDLSESPNITKIGYRAFNGCTALTSFTIPDSVTSIGEYAFYGCDALTSITIPDSVTNIDANAFSYCKNLASITFSGKLTSIGNSAFISCTALTSITIPDSVTNIDAYAFRNCTSLTSITILDNLTTIGGSVFSGCTSLTSITLPDNLTNIGNYMFNGCTALTSFTIPDSVTNIGEYAFYGCSKLQNVIIGNSVTRINRYVFSGCTALTSATFKTTSGWWVSTSSTATTGTNITSSYLANTSTAATYLNTTYRSYYWNRT